MESITSANHLQASLLQAFLDSLDAGQRRKAVFTFTDRERFNWHYIPRHRQGVPLKAMNVGQRQAADDLLKFALSEAGYRKARDIMRLEEVLRAQEWLSSLFRDPDNYSFTLFGEPPVVPWGWRVEGHHLALNFTVADREHIAVTPAFTGSNPAEVRAGPLTGLRVQAAEQDLARELVQSLEPAHLAKALLQDRSLGDIVTGPGREETLKTPVGLPLREMNDARRGLVMRLIEAYIRTMRDSFAQLQLDRIQEAGIEQIHFAWAGGLEPGQAHYYRLHGPRLLIEYDNTQNDANHIHTVWHDPQDKFGADALRAHYTRYGHEPAT